MAGDSDSAQRNDGFGLSGGWNGDHGVAECGMTSLQAGDDDWDDLAAAEEGVLMTASGSARSARYVADLDLGGVLAQYAEVAQDVDQKVP